jgi:hypothetical protein
VAFLAGEDITAGRLNRLQPVKTWVYQSAPLVGPQTVVLVPGCTFSYVTEMPNAKWMAWWFLDFDNTGTQTGTSLGRVRVAGFTAPVYGSWPGEVTTDRGSPGNQASGTLGAAGTYLFELVATLQTNTQLNAATSLCVEITEVA